MDYLCTMTRMRKIALIGIASATVLMIIAIIAGFPPAVAGVHALPFVVLLLFDISRKRDLERQKQKEEQSKSS